MSVLYSPPAQTATHRRSAELHSALPGKLAAAAATRTVPKLAPPLPVKPSAIDVVKARPTGATALSHETLGGSPLDPRMTFASFVLGRANTLAHAAARQVAEGRRGDPVMFNPLYIHAGVGLGKTHLLQAVTWAGNSSLDRKVLYLTAEKFMYGFVAALRDQKRFAIRQALRGLDVVIVDDVQFLVGKAFRSDICEVINTLIDDGRQVVIAADRPPSDLEGLDDRIVSRLTSGLVVEMSPPNDDLRLGMLCARVAAAQERHAAFVVPQPVLDLLSQSDLQTGRDLEAAVNRLFAQSKLNGAEITLDLAEREIRDLIRPMEPRRVKIEDIQRVVARHYGVSKSDILSSRRTANVVRPRQVAMYLAKTMTLRSLPEIGRRFGKRDHTTVLHAVRKIENLVSKDNDLRDQVENFKNQLREGN